MLSGEVICDNTCGNTAIWLVSQSFLLSKKLVLVFSNTLKTHKTFLDSIALQMNSLIYISELQCCSNLNFFSIAVIFQLSLVEREINEVMRGSYSRSSRAAKRGNSEKDMTASDSREKLKQKQIEEQDMCPICQDELLLKPEPITYCKWVCKLKRQWNFLNIWQA